MYKNNFFFLFSMSLNVFHFLVIPIPYNFRTISIFVPNLITGANNKYIELQFIGRPCVTSLAIKSVSVMFI